MKKLMAALLALMLLASAALAEVEATNTRGTTVEVSNIVMYNTMDGQRQMADLSDLKFSLTFGTLSGRPAGQLHILRGGETMGLVAGQAVGNQFLYSARGAQNAYLLDAQTNVPGFNYDTQTVLAGLVRVLESIGRTKLPEFRGVEIPAIDIRALLEKSITDQKSGLFTGTEYAFTIPYTEINSQLNSLLQAAGLLLPQVAGNFGVSSTQINQIMSQMNRAVQQLRQTNSGIQISGTITESLGMNLLQADVWMVENGGVVDGPLMYVTLRSAPNDLYVAVGPSDTYYGSENEGFAFALTSDPAARRLSATFSAASTGGLAFETYPDGDLQRYELRLDTLSYYGSRPPVTQTQKLGFAHGSVEGMDVVEIYMNAPDTSLRMRLDTAPARSAFSLVKGARAGTLTGDFSDRYNNRSFSCDIALMDNTAGAPLWDIQNAQGALDATWGSNARLADEDMDRALGAFMNYMDSIRPVDVAP